MDGKELEVRFGDELGHGWGYNHALNKLYTFQAKVLDRWFQEVPQAPTLLEEAERFNDEMEE